MSISSPESEDAESQPKITALIADLANDDGMIRQDAREALVEIGTAAVPQLVEALANPRDQVRWEAAKSLVDVVDPRAASALVLALEDEDDGVRWLAAEALIALGEKALAPLLHALTERSDSTELREGCHHVIHDLPVWKIVRALSPVLAALEDAAPETVVPVAANTALDVLKS